MKKNSKKDILFYACMVIPAIFVYVLIIIYPVIQSTWWGLTDFNVYTGEIAWNNFAHFKKMFADPIFWMAFKNNLIVMAVSVFGQIPLGFALAYILFRSMIKGTSFFQAIVFLPQTISTIIIGILWNAMFNPKGLVTKIIQTVTDDPSFMITWQLKESTAMIPIMFALIWIYTGFFTIMFLANMQKLNASLIEAAAIDGANEFQIFTKIVAPSLVGVTVTNAVLAIAGSFRGFDLIFSISEGGPAHYTEVLPIYMYNNSFKQFKYDYGSAIATVLVIISLFFVLISKQVGKRFDKL